MWLRRTQMDAASSASNLRPSAGGRGRFPGAVTAGVGVALAATVLAGCPSGSQELPPVTAATPQTVVVSEVPAPTAAPSPTVVVVQPQSPQTVVQVVPQGSTDGAVSIPSGVAEGDYCKWLGANGYSFGQAQATYYALGSPSHMDADRNGIPCETVYG